MSTAAPPQDAHVTRTCPRCGLDYTETPAAAQEPHRSGWCPRCGQYPKEDDA